MIPQLMKMVGYKILNEQHPEVMEEVVARYIAIGWELEGPLHVHNNGYTQVMTRWIELPDEDEDDKGYE